MKFLLYTTGDNTQPSAPPTPQMIEEVGKFTEETRRAGILLATGGLAPTTTRVRAGRGQDARRGDRVGQAFPQDRRRRRQPGPGNIRVDRQCRVRTHMEP